ncbi:OLC1v1033719C2 [Oldenlandia corymbosa var. corymbosa]|uniref:OLC1v1033719C2 n=1 Tax=Oldenlandia corymbosa var. corymbosa TaxID=529605 RepID=A0AAV1CPN6_OLDCO|nr:OLC1v1033719C2 [Oldenlandia corymbosa var. corymbosa]
MELFAASSSAKLFVVENHQHQQGYKLQHPLTHFQQSHSNNIPAKDASSAGALFLIRPNKHCPASPLLHRKSFRPVSSSPSTVHALSSASEAQTIAAEESSQNKDATEFKTVHIKFELKRECSFGLHFFMVGEDPMFGLWDPENAIPLNWSDGHVWALELDVPCGKVIKYKFILKGGGDYILWQPGPDRILQTWGTEKTIIVSEDWDNAELQTIVEADPITHQLSESMEHSQVLKETENLFQLNGDSPESYFEKEFTSESEHNEPNEAVSDEKPTPAIVEDIPAGQNGEKDVEVNGFPVSDFIPSTNKAGNLGKMTSSSLEMDLDSGPRATARVLVPGLTPVPMAENEEEISVSEAEEHLLTDSLNIPEVTA